MPRTRPLRLGFFTYLETGDGKSQAEVYQEVLELYIAADQLGFDVGWVAQHHFGHHGGLPSPFVFLAAVAERTRAIGIGTAIVSLALENPIRVAEDAAVLEALYPGRLELGIGTGFASEAVLATFDRAGADRRQLYEAALVRLRAAFAGEPVNDADDRLNPPAPALLSRLWESPASNERAAEAGRRGSGLLLSRIAIGNGGRPSPEIQVPLVNSYIDALPAGVPPRIGFSRTVYPSRRPEIAFRDLRDGLEVSVAAQVAAGQPPDGLTVEQRFRHHNVHHGTPEQVIRSLQEEPLLDEITDLICQVQPGLPSHAQTLDAIELIATKVVPALGWRPAAAKAAAAAD